MECAVEVESMSEKKRESPARGERINLPMVTEHSGGR